MLKDRLRTSAILISIVACLLYLDGHYSKAGAEGLWLLPLLLFFALGTAADMSSLLSKSGRMISRRMTMIATAMVTLSACIPLLWPLFGSVYPPACPVGRLGWIVLASIAATFVILVGEMSQYGKEGNPNSGTIERTCGAVFVSLYVGLPMAVLVALRSLGSGNWGLAALLVTIAVTKSTDAGAYFSGKALGKHKLIPRLSPGKTREGAIGGILTATIVAFVCLKWLFPQIAGASIGPVMTPSIPGVDQPFWGALLLGPLLAVSGMIGDLAESLIKRDSGAKDSGNWLPGLGGVWDVTDSLIAAVLPAFLCYVAGVAA
ncbi:MAG: phosphatidate cytidylyltransferase [Rubripirellula sp.]